MTKNSNAEQGDLTEYAWQILKNATKEFIAGISR